MIFRKTYAPLLVALAVSACSITQAALITEDFSYADGPLAGANGGTGWSTAWGSSSSVNTPQNEYQVIAGEAIFVGNNVNQEAISQTRAFDAPYAIGVDTELTLQFDIIINENQLGRGVGVSLVDTTNGQALFFGKQINQSNTAVGGSGLGIHSSMLTAGDDYAVFSTLASSVTLTATITSDGTDTFASLSDGNETISATLAGAQFVFDSLELNGYHRYTLTNGVDAISMDVTAVPEPATYLLLGLAGAIGALWKRL